VPGVAEEEVGNLEKRIFGETVNGVRDAWLRGAHAACQPEAAKALRDKLVGEVYSDKASRLLDLGELQAAENVVRAHETELGEQGKELRGQIVEKERVVRASTKATELASQFKLRDGNVDTLKASKWIVDNISAGPERIMHQTALAHEAERVKQGVEAKDKANWDSLLGDYHQYGRSYWDVVSKSASWKTATSQQRENLYQRWKADTRAAEGDPPTDLQLKAYGTLSWDVASRNEYWGTTDYGALEKSADYNALPPHLRKQVVELVKQAHTDRGNLNVASTHAAILKRAQMDGYPLAGTFGKKYAELDPTEQASWDHIMDRATSVVAEWKDKNPKATFVPISVTNDAVDQVTRTATVKSGRWYWPTGKHTVFNQGDVPIEKAAGSGFEFTPNMKGDEESVGREVLRRQGVRDEEMTPGKVIEAAHLARTVTSGTIPPQDRERIRKLLSGAGRNPGDASIRTYWEAEQLHYLKD
jgi:hypothetical protein